MPIRSKQLFILLGNDLTGKTTLQRLLIKKLCGISYDRLPVNRIFDITHPEIKRKYRHISFGNRSYQEKKEEYSSVENYFNEHFQEADIAFISSHLVEPDVREMIRQGRLFFYNVTGIFFSNSVQLHTQDNSAISLLDWNERLMIENPVTTTASQWDSQLEAIADNIIIFIANRTGVS